MYKFVIARRRKCRFYMDDGGFAGTDELDNPTNYIYYLGVIDILTPYNTVKKVEHTWKSLKDDKVFYLNFFRLIYLKCG